MFTFVLTSLVGPFVLLLFVGSVRKLMGLQFFGPGTDLALLLATLDATLLMGGPRSHEIVVQAYTIPGVGLTLGPHTTDVGQMATLLLMAGMIAVVASVAAEDAIEKCYAAETAVAEDWCSEEEIGDLPPSLRYGLASWSLIALVPFAGNVVLLLEVL